MRTHPFLCPVVAGVALLLSTAHAADPLKVNANSLAFEWTPVEGFTLRCSGGPSEVGPDPRFPDRNVWKAPKIVPGKGSPAGTGSKLDLKQERDWIEEHRDGTIEWQRVVQATGTKLTIRDQWKCEPTENAFFTQGFGVKLADHLDMEFSLIGAKGSVKVEEKSVEAFARNRTSPFAKNAKSVIADGVEIRKIGGGTLRIKASEPLKVEWLYDDNDNVSVRFMPDDTKELKSGEVGFDLEFSKTSL